MFLSRNSTQIRHFSKRLFSSVADNNCNSQSQKKHKIGILGVPQNKGQGKQGVEDAPDALRAMNLIDVLKDLSTELEITDYGNLKYESSKDLKDLENMKNWREVYGCNKALYEKVQKIAKENDQFLVIGGDHSIATGSVAGHLAHDPNLVLLWVDAHADVNVNKTSPSGNIHGMPVSFLVQELTHYWENHTFFSERICAKKVAYIGLRDVDPFEKYFIEKLGMTAFGMAQVDKYGIHKIMEMLFDRVDPRNEFNYHVSYDIDSLDPVHASSTGTPVPGGLTVREGIYILEQLAETNRIRGMDLVEINPKLGTKEDVHRTLMSALEILKAVYGTNRLGDPKEIKKYEKITKP